MKNKKKPESESIPEFEKSMDNLSQERKDYIDNLLITNLDKSSANWEKIKDKDKWLKEFRGNSIDWTKPIIIFIIMFLTAIIVMSLFSCAKESELLPQCSKCSLISYKYNAEMVLFRTDILWYDDNVCGDELRKVRSAKQVDTLTWWNCPPPDNFPNLRMEIRKYIY